MPPEEKSTKEDWFEYKRLVLKALEQNDSAIESVKVEMGKINISIATLQATASVWGAIWGAVGGILCSVVVAVILATLKVK